MSPAVAKTKIIRALDELPPESLAQVATFVEKLHSKTGKRTHSKGTRHVVKLGGLWKGYSFSDEDIRAARREAWTGLGRDLSG